MNLKDSIKAKCCSMESGGATSEKNLLGALECYLGKDADVALAEVARPGWVKGFYDYLCTDYETRKKNKGKDESEVAQLKLRRAKNRISSLNPVLSFAITMGWMPNLDLVGMSGIDVSDRDKPVSPDYISGIRGLVKMRDTVYRGLIDRYLLCLYFGGVNFDQLKAILEGIDATTEFVELPHLPFRLQLSYLLRAKIADFKSRPRAESEKRSKNRVVEDPFVSLMRMCSVPMFQSGDVFVDWLILLQQTPGIEVSEGEIQALFAAPASVSEERFNQLARQLLDSWIKEECRHEEEHWYILRSIRSTGVAVKDSLLENKELYPSLDEKHIYCPCKSRPAVTSLDKKLARQNRVYDNLNSLSLRRFLFVNATLSTIEKTQRDAKLPDVYIYPNKANDKKKYAVVSPREIAQIKDAINEFSLRDEEPGDHDIITQAEAMATGCQVKITGGKLAGFEGRVSKTLKNARGGIVGYEVTMTINSTATLKIPVSADKIEPLMRKAEEA